MTQQNKRLLSEWMRRVQRVNQELNNNAQVLKSLMEGEGIDNELDYSNTESKNRTCYAV